MDADSSSVPRIVAGALQFDLTNQYSDIVPGRRRFTVGRQDPALNCWQRLYNLDVTYGQYTGRSSSPDQGVTLDVDRWGQIRRVSQIDVDLMDSHPVDGDVRRPCSHWVCSSADTLGWWAD